MSNTNTDIRNGVIRDFEEQAGSAKLKREIDRIQKEMEKEAGGR